MFLVVAEFNFYSNRDHFMAGHHSQPTPEDARPGNKTLNYNGSGSDGTYAAASC
jgi:hypothetical protein